jgi:hypothetical protein
MVGRKTSTTIILDGMKIETLNQGKALLIINEILSMET